MEDKFGYLMEEEFEEDFLEQIRELVAERKRNHKYKVGLSPWDLHNRVTLTWGGKHEKDKKEYKIR